ncbi:pleckstrin homology domain-containing family A member 4 [Tachyglossus aculeatus]|uniref:pleckstrin homology domain-containing family A member 4 n=1 Tax=Tachyglossus aculeatus TaxID=9261 RepID=UPI0018F2DC05|nr:pleckstrin homology domain-containing family A member 4 [Tachyglossus aculeatus]
MEDGRPRSSLSVSSSVSTASSLNLSSKPARPVSRVHAFGKRESALKRDPNLAVQIRGWLYKQDSSGLRLWKRRWFVLSGHCLFYYRDSREESVLGSVLLPSYSVRPDGPGMPRGRRFTFTAEHPGMRTYVLGADTQEDLRGWLRALGRAARAEGEDSFPSRGRPSLQPGPEGPGGPGGPPELGSGDEDRSAESLEVARISESQRGGGLPPSSPARPEPREPRSPPPRSPELFSPLSRPPSPLGLPRPRSAPARRPPPHAASCEELGRPSRPHTPVGRLDVRPQDWATATPRRPISRPSTPRRPLATEEGRARPPRKPLDWTQESGVSPGPSPYLQLPPRPPGSRTSLAALPGAHADSTLRRGAETDVLLNRLCGQDRLLRGLEEEMARRREEKEQLEAALELTRRQLSLVPDQEPAVAVTERIWTRQRLLQDRLVCVRAGLCQLTLEHERVWENYSGLEQELKTLRETLEYLLQLGSPQARASAQQQLWMVEDTLEGLGSPSSHKLPPYHLEAPGSPLLPRRSSPKLESPPQGSHLDLGIPGSPDLHWGSLPKERDTCSTPTGLSSPGSPSTPRPDIQLQLSPQPGAKSTARGVRPRMSAQEQLERMRRHQETCRPLPCPASLGPRGRLGSLGGARRTLSPSSQQPLQTPEPVNQVATLAPDSPEASDQPVVTEWIRSSGSWSSPRSPAPAYVPPPEGHRERVLSLSYALAAEASHWHRLLTGRSLAAAAGEPSQSSPVPRATPPTNPRGPRPPASTNESAESGPAPWGPSSGAGPAPSDEGPWPPRVTLLQSSF